MSTLGTHLFGVPAARTRVTSDDDAGSDGDSSFSSNDSFAIEMRKLDHRPLLKDSSLMTTPALKAQLPGQLLNGKYQRSRGGVAIRPEVDESDLHDYAFKVKSLHESFTPEMRETIRKLRDNTPLTDFDRECLNRGVDVDVLRDLKAAFSIVHKGVQGVQEVAFTSTFCPALCDNLTPEEIRLWFRNIDENCSGAVSWAEIAEYIGAYRGDQNVNRSYFVDFTVEANNAARRTGGHKALVTKMLHNVSLDLLYTCAPDGYVCAWDPHLLRPRPAPIHNLGSPVLDMSLCQHNNRLLVLQADCSVFVYDTYLDVSREPQHTLFRGYASRAARTLHDGTSFYDVKATRGTNSVVIPVSLLQSSKDNFRCLDNLGGQSHGEPMVCGTEGGYLELYNLILGSQKPIAPFARYKPHTNWITSVRHVPQMMGILSSSLDGSCIVTDVETGVATQTMCLEGKRRKPVHVTAYHPQNHVFITASGRTLHVWNALTGARLTSLSDHETMVTAIAINAERQHVYAMQENKCLKVWDLRTWRSLDETQDTIRRAPFDSVNCISWCDSNHLVVAASTSLFGWRPADIQERLDAGLSPTEVETRIHLLPITSMQCLPKTGHIWSVDHERAFVWGTDGKHRMKMWKIPFPDAITCTSVNSDELRSVVGTEAGRVLWINYANGYIFTELKHPYGAHHVRGVVITSGVVETAPPLAFAVMGRKAFGWSSDKSAPLVVKAPVFDFTLPADVPGALESIVELDEERKVMAVVTTHGMVTILSIGLSPLATFDFVDSPFELSQFTVTENRSAIVVETVIVPMAGLIISGASDGMVRCYGVQGDSDMFSAPLASFRGSAGTEGVTALYHRGHQLICGDGDGAVMIFNCKKLLDEKYIQKEVLPNLNNPAMLLKYQTVCAHLVDLEHAFRAHTAAVVSIGIVNNNELITASADKHIRAWKCDGTWPFVCDIGRTNALPVIDPGDADVTPREGYLGPLGTVLTDHHPFHDVVSTQNMNRRRSDASGFLGRQETPVASSFEKGAAPIRIPPHHGRSRAQSIVSMLPPLPHQSAQQRSLFSNTTSPAVSRPPSAKSIERSRRASLAALQARGFSQPPPVVQKTTTVKLSALECFRKSTDRALQMRASLVRDEPYENPIQETISTVDFAKERKAHEVREETKRAFSLLTLPPIQGNPFATAKAKAAQMHQPRRSRTSLR